jgi:hypothetical protein
LPLGHFVNKHVARFSDAIRKIGDQGLTLSLRQKDIERRAERRRAAVTSRKAVQLSWRKRPWNGREDGSFFTGRSGNGHRISRRMK